MNDSEQIARNESWRSGENRQGDEALALAQDALRANETTRCFACIRVAMMRYGWEFHSDRIARKLWKKWDQIALQLRNATSACKSDMAIEIEDLFHETFRAIHYDRNRRIRRNPAPRDPAALPAPVIPAGIGEFQQSQTRQSASLSPNNAEYSTLPVIAQSRSVTQHPARVLGVLPEDFW